MSSNTNNSQIIELLNKNSNERNDKELQLLFNLLKDIKFFKTRDIQGADLLEVCKEIKHEFVPKGDFVFRAGEYGDKFYIILNG